MTIRRPSRVGWSDSCPAGIGGVLDNDPVASARLGKRDLPVDGDGAAGRGVDLCLEQRTKDWTLYRVG